MDMKMDDENDQNGDGTHFNSSVRSVALLMSTGKSGGQKLKIAKRGSVDQRPQNKIKHGKNMNMDEDIMIRSPKTKEGTTQLAHGANK